MPSRRHAVAVKVRRKAGKTTDARWKASACKRAPRQHQILKTQCSQPRSRETLGGQVMSVHPAAYVACCVAYFRLTNLPAACQACRKCQGGRQLQKEATHPRKQRSAGGIRGTLRWGAEAFQQVDQRVYRISGWWLRFRAGTLNHESAQQLPLRWHGASTLQLRTVAAILLWQIQE